MVKDRLEELRSKCKLINHSDNEVNVEIMPTKSQNEIIEQLEKFSEVTAWISAIRDNIEVMRKAISSAAFHYNDKGIRDKVESKIQESVDLCSKIYNVIKSVQAEIESEVQLGTILFRIKHTQFMLIKDDYLNAYREHEAFITYYEEKIKKLMVLERRTMSYNITVDDVPDSLINQQMAFFVGNILEETETQRQQLRGIMTRHTQLEHLEKSLIEIRDLFVQMSTMVLEQGSLIQVVEYHAQRATLDIDKGAEQLEKARDLQIKALKKKSCILIWVTIVLILLILLIIVF